ncbi:hypothetical protein HT136_01490 [Novosphingobium profundi]|uniref:hypothetical protein n=1 Tax=Novosphingobium profundi TaxID=1774954 RepID=UPI001BD959CB|nr:hypothetical protein [Novosphingobium profundi]MBT0667040.1 hypothetical protein [Novosphingobium profundi]
MADKGIIFSAPMVRALLDGRKTQTRRLLKPKGGLPAPVNLAAHGVGTYSGEDSDPASWGWPFAEDGSDASLALFPDLSGYAPGDRLYVREAWRTNSMWDARSGAELASENAQFGRVSLHYDADGASAANSCEREGCGRYRHARFMPRWASRLWLEVTEVRVQRVREISETDAIAEGCVPNDGSLNPNYIGPAISIFSHLWNRLHTKPGETWQDNPWIVAISFKVHTGNIDGSQA